MTSLLIAIKHRFPAFWRLVERLNGRLFAWRFPAFDAAVAEELGRDILAGFDFSPVAEADLDRLSAFLTAEAAGFDHFDPHPFDPAALRRLRANRAFAMMQVTERESGVVAGYFFLRGFFVGKAFHGLAVGERFRGRGIGTAMWALSARICNRAGLRLFATVSKHNAASLASLRKAVRYEVAEELANDYLLITCSPQP